MFANVIRTMFAIFPSWFTLAILGFITAFVFFLAFKVISAILDAIPFL